MHTYQSFEAGLWTVGFYNPNGTWVSVSDHGSEFDAIVRVRFLNGGEVPDADSDAKKSARVSVVPLHWEYAECSHIAQVNVLAKDGWELYHTACAANAQENWTVFVLRRHVFEVTQ